VVLEKFRYEMAVSCKLQKRKEKILKMSRYYNRNKADITNPPMKKIEIRSWSGRRTVRYGRVPYGTVRYGKSVT